MGPFGYSLFCWKLKIENWKYCSKIIFKCVNSAVWPIFNEKVAENWIVWVPWTMHRTHWYTLFTEEMSTIAAKKKEKKNAKKWKRRRVNVKPNTHYDVFKIFNKTKMYFLQFPSISYFIFHQYLLYQYLLFFLPHFTNIIEKDRKSVV